MITCNLREGVEENAISSNCIYNPLNFKSGFFGHDFAKNLSFCLKFLVFIDFFLGYFQNSPLYIDNFCHISLKIQVFFHNIIAIAVYFLLYLSPFLLFFFQTLPKPDKDPSTDDGNECKS